MEVLVGGAGVSDGPPGVTENVGAANVGVYVSARVEVIVGVGVIDGVPSKHIS